MRKITMMTVAVGLLLMTAWVPVAQAGGGCRRGDGPTVASGSAITMKLSCFTPAVLWVQPGQTVTWTNNDAQEHSVSGPRMGINAGDMAQGAKYSLRFDNVGIFPFQCVIHYGMSGAVVVGAPKAPSVSESAPDPNSGSAGVVTPPDSGSPPAKDVAKASDTISEVNGQLSGATKTQPNAGTAYVAISIGAAGAIGFAAGRSRRRRDKRGLSTTQPA